MSGKIVVKADHVTKDYGDGRGNFDISLNVREGETVGIVGENGAGKTTLLRQIMGFIKSDSGEIKIYGMNAYQQSAMIKKYIGYIPGEINFPDVKSGSQFLKDYGRARRIPKENFDYADELIQRMQLDVRAYPKRMSKGMKQKTAVVACMMLKTPLIVMDEPTLGLDPLMREELLEIIAEQKERGATILFTSNTIEELERVCDRVAYLTQGKIMDIASVKEVKDRPVRDLKIRFEDETSYVEFLKTRNDILSVKPEDLQVVLRVNKLDINVLFDSLNAYKITYVTEVKYNLSDYFEERRKELKAC